MFRRLSVSAGKGPGGMGLSHTWWSAWGLRGSRSDCGAPVPPARTCHPHRLSHLVAAWFLELSHRQQCPEEVAKRKKAGCFFVPQVAQN